MVELQWVYADYIFSWWLISLILSPSIFFLMKWLLNFSVQYFFFFLEWSKCHFSIMIIEA